MVPTIMIRAIKTRHFPAPHLVLGLILLHPLALHAREADASPSAGSKTLRDLSYVKEGHPRQKLDLYLPERNHEPLLVYIHGGGWREGSKAHVTGLEQIVAQGFAVASVEYRFSQDAVFPAQIEDCKSAIRWLRAHAADYGYDPARIAAFGESAGGHLTALLATTGTIRDFDKGENLEQSSAIQCGIDWFGPTDFPGFRPPNGQPNPRDTGKDSILGQLFGGPPLEKLDLARRASPVTWVTKSTAPLYIMHGTKDPLVPLDQSTELADKMKDAGVDVTLDVIEGAGHGGPQFTAGDKPLKMFEFLNRHLPPNGGGQQ
jgi:acetyl esterase/lipase